MKLSSSNLIAVIGFLSMSSIGVFYIFQPKFIHPLNVLCNVREIDATLNENYTERRSTRSGVTLTSYEITYTYTVDGKEYSGNSVTSDHPKKAMKVQYLKNDPGDNGAELTGHAWIDLGIFVIVFVVWSICCLALWLHFTRGRD